MKKYNKLLDSKGLTLIEVIVALSILLVVTTSFLTLFTNGFSTIFSAGQKTTAVFKAQEVMEGQLAGLPVPSGTVENVTVTEKTSANLSINFDGKIIQVKGKTLEVEYRDNKQNVKFNSFMAENRGD